MSNIVQDKLTNYEAVPPKEVWANIASELDDSCLSDSFPNTLKNIEVAPPQNAWASIAASLNASETSSSPYAEKLKNAEVAAPSQIWDKIKDALEVGDKAVPAKTLPFISVLKYAAAAILVGALVFTGIRMMNNEKGNKDSLAIRKIDTSVATNTIAATSPSNENKNETASNTNEENTVSVAEEKRNEEALEASKHTYAKFETPSLNRLKEIASAYHFTSSVDASNYPDAIESAQNINRYITVMSPDCSPVRMSKKFEDISCCISGESVDKNCILQVDKWRKQAAAASAMRPANFMGIMDMIDALDKD